MDCDKSHISKQQVASVIVTAFESSSVKIAEYVKESENLIQELSNYELGRSESRHAASF